MIIPVKIDSASFLGGHPVFVREWKFMVFTGPSILAVKLRGRSLEKSCLPDRQTE